MSGQEQYYTRRFTRRHPGLFIIMLDQSGSMAEQIESGGGSKADFATTAINNLIYELVQMARIDLSTGKRRKYAYLSILGYNDTVYPLLSPEPMDIPFLGEHNRGTVPTVRDIYDSHTESYRQTIENRAFWIEPYAMGKTNIADAFTRARDIARHWFSQPLDLGQAQRQECFPPLIINITDAHNNSDRDYLPITREIQREGTQQGSMLICNCHFSTLVGESCIFPSDVSEVAHLDPPFAAQLFEASSVIPEPLRKKAIEEFGRDFPQGARSFIYNAEPAVLVKFLHWGTVGAAV